MGAGGGIRAVVGGEVSLIQIGIALLILAAVAGTGYAVVHTYNSKIEEAALWKDRAEKEAGNVKAWQASASYWQTEGDRLSKAITLRDKRLADERRERTRLYATIEEHKRSDPELQKWSDTPLPPFVIEQLRSVAANPGSTDRPPTNGSRESIRARRDSTVARID